LATARARCVSAAGFSLDPRDDLTEGLHPPVLHVEDLDGVVAERRAYRLGRDLALLEREHRFLELRHHLAFTHEAEITPLGRGGGVLGQLPGDLAEVLATLGATNRLLDLGLGLVLRLAASGGGHAHENVGGLEALRALELAPVLLVVRLGVGIGHREGK
jgi:hypothetical protein